MANQFKFGHFKLVKIAKKIGSLDVSETTSLDWSTTSLNWWI